MTTAFSFQVRAGPRLVVSPEQVTRGGTVTFALEGALNASISGWQFVATITGDPTQTGSDSIARSTGTNLSTWSGTIVAQGVASVIVNGQTLSSPTVGVTPRSWSSPAKPANQRPVGYEVRDPITLDVIHVFNPADPGTGQMGVGETFVALKSIVTQSQLLTVADSGPNQGVKYLTDVTDLTMVDWSLHVRFV